MCCKMHRVLRSPGFRYAFAPAIGLAGAGALAWNARDCAPSSRVPGARPSFLSSLSASMPCLAAFPGIRPEFGLVSSRSDDSLARALEEALGQSGGATPQQPPPRSRFVRKRGPTSPSGRMLIESLLAANGLVWLAHQFPPLQSFMMRNFATTPRNLSEGAAGIARMFASTFSHKSFVHLLANMAGLWTIGPNLLRTYSLDPKSPVLSLGEFMAMYVTAGMAGAVASSLFHRSLGMHIPALGASGSIFGVLGYFLLANPDAQMLLLFVIPAGATTTTLASVAINGYLVFRTWRMARAGIVSGGIDGMAHLAGHAVGALWYLKRRAEESSKLAAGGPPGSSYGPGGKTVTAPFGSPTSSASTASSTSSSYPLEEYAGDPHRARGGSRYAEDDWTGGSDSRSFGAGEDRPRGGGGISV